MITVFCKIYSCCRILQLIRFELLINKLSKRNYIFYRNSNVFSSFNFLFTKIMFNFFLNSFLHLFSKICNLVFFRLNAIKIEANICFHIQVIKEKIYLIFD